MNKLVMRLATKNDLPQLADLRWRLQTGDAEEYSAATREAFVADFVAAPDHLDRSLLHFVAENDNKIVGAMSIRKVRKVPAPDRLEAYWGYLTNCYVRSDFRGKSVGSQLLDFVTQWAKDENLEFLVVWPSDRAYPFYERKGFRRQADPLVLKLDA
jgi:GNAT superfamily N-acetyltransferase